MRRKAPNAMLPLHDYRAALHSAVAWLGDRYLLAEPTPRLEENTPYFAEQRRWHPAVVAVALAKASR